MGKAAVDHPAEEGSMDTFQHVDMVLSEHDPEKAGPANNPTVTEIRPEPKRGWRNFIWDSLDKSPEERRLVQKIDLALLTLGCLSYFVKYLDQININNAFVSGMKEDLSLYGNQLNIMQTCWGVGYLLGGLPSNILLTRVRPSRFIPLVEVLWGGLTLCLTACKTAKQIYVVRFFVGLFESALYPGMIYIIGSWYRSDELAKRTCIFQVTSAVGTMFSGYLMAAVYHLDGQSGLHGWQWLFLVDGLITLPIAVACFFLLPDLPSNCRARYLSKEEITLAQVRMELEGRASREPFSKAKIKRIVFGTWHWWVLVPMYTFWNNGGSSAQPVFAQYLKNFDPPKYSVAQINTYPTITGGVQVFTTLFFAWTSDGFLKGRRWPAVIVGGCFNIMCYSSLWHWNIPEGWRWACYALSGVGSSVAGLIMSWAHEICSSDNEERAIVTGSMNQMAYVFQMWLPLVAWKQTTAPQYTSGFATITFFNVCMIFFALLALYLQTGFRKI
ncbi:hypothetical protein G647_01685 [Cladophialophora carrionii CBS 160.54]|uniref:Major facilitator superfamily (MFS) profile domain-containing protein n=1 Tax=Cladophialophora carrionii CBS 160.54 TaxID=1279043 RepID=V9DTC1_9EURO|nr:uncharacterized protein G647_01685 [Cladophialophora carrionii CBS 160.54]ETI29232.1 hypothetical protein G647_01685 [Cladophialophora carrionii CBS 160.54]